LEVPAGSEVGYGGWDGWGGSTGTGMHGAGGAGTGGIEVDEVHCVVPPGLGDAELCFDAFKVECEVEGGAEEVAFSYLHLDTEVFDGWPADNGVYCNVFAKGNVELDGVPVGVRVGCVVSDDCHQLAMVGRWGVGCVLHRANELNCFEGIAIVALFE